MWAGFEAIEGNEKRFSHMNKIEKVDRKHQFNRVLPHHE